MTAVLGRVVRAGLIGKGMFEQRSQGEGNRQGNAGEGPASVRTLITGWVWCGLCNWSASATSQKRFLAWGLRTSKGSGIEFINLDQKNISFLSLIITSN